MVSTSITEASYRRSHPVRYLGHGLGAVISPPRPEETLQAIAPTAGHDVDMEMGHALADDVVDAHEDALRPHRFPHGSRHKLSGFKEWPQFRWWYVKESGIVDPRHYQAMAREEWSVVQEGRCVRGAQDELMGHLAADDLAKQTFAPAARGSGLRRPHRG